MLPEEGRFASHNLYDSRVYFMGVLNPDYMDSMQVATQYLLPELAGKSLTPKLSIVVADAFVTRFGSYAGWAQNVLFIGQLPAQKVVIAKVTTDGGTTKSTKRKRAGNRNQEN